ncbi:MAG: hypothetical protein JNK43_01895 [Ignavibacteria bacterium]|nr:hypothetical protein [Ignavibacteria bacterium]
MTIKAKWDKYYPAAGPETYTWIFIQGRMFIINDETYVEAENNDDLKTKAEEISNAAEKGDLH